MSKAAIAIASLCAGLGVFVMIAKLQEDPLLLTAHSNTGVEPQNPTVASARDAASITLDAVRAALGPVEAVSNLQGEPQKTVTHQQAPAGDEPVVTSPSEAPRELAPCSPWRDLGPKLGPVRDEPSSRSVRQLC